MDNIIKYRLVAKSEDGKYLDSEEYNMSEFEEENISVIKRIINGDENEVKVDGKYGVTLVKGREPFYWEQENSRDELLSKEITYLLEDIKNSISHLNKYVFEKLDYEDTLNGKVEFAMMIIKEILNKRKGFMPNSTRICAKAPYGGNYFKFDLEQGIWKDDINDAMKRLGFDTYIDRTLSELNVNYIIKNVIPNFYNSLCWIKNPTREGVRELFNYSLEID